jgi:DNA-binding XRE family transcriptional regulator
MDMFIKWQSLLVFVNPVTALREQLGMSQQSFARACEIPVNTVYFTENGTTASVSSKIHEYFDSRFNDYNQKSISNLYLNWIVRSRDIVKHTVSFPPVASTILFAKEEHPFRRYITAHYSISGFSILTKIPKNVIYHYITPGRQETMPQSINTALRQCGMDESEIKELDMAGILYYRSVLRQRISERRSLDEQRT